MYRRLNIFLIIGAVFTIITGTLLHFVYEWSGESLFVGIFSPINESVWEHLKLLFFPMSVWILIGYFIFGKKFKTYIPSAVIGILSGMILIPMWFYTYTVFTGKPILFLDILSFIISVCVAFFITAHLIENYNIPYLTPKLGFLIWDIIFALFIIFTLCQPDFPLFISY